MIIHLHTGRAICPLRLCACLLIGAMLAACPARAAVDTAAGRASAALKEGIDRYRAGDRDGALSALNRAVGANERLPLAYYYAARIRLENGQLDRARTNLEAALRDSASFADARGLLAVVLNREGSTAAAIATWAAFIAAVPDGKDIAPDTSIMDPEAFHVLADVQRRQLENARLRQEEDARLRRERDAADAKLRRDDAALRDRMIREQVDNPAAGTDTIATASNEGGAGQTAPADTAIYNEGNGAGGAATADSTATALDNTTAPVLPSADLEARIRSGIRHGVTGIVAAVVLLVAGIIVAWALSRRKRTPEPGFDEDMERLLDQVNRDSTVLEDEDALARSFNTGRGDMTAAAGPSSYPRPSRDAGFADGARRGYEDSVRRPDLGGPREADAGARNIAWRLDTGGTGGTTPDNPAGPDPRPLITEEIKALVVRMHREGHTIQEICRVADLTRTEVTLIVAVRATSTGRLASEARSTIGEPSEAIATAIVQMTTEGMDVASIARTLGISTGEVRFAQAVQDLRVRSTAVDRLTGHRDRTTTQGEQLWRTIREWGSGS